MSIELEKKSLNDTVGKPPKFKATFRGYYRGVQCVLSFEAETERDLSYIVPLIPGRNLELEIRDPQATLDAFSMGEELVEEISANTKRVQEEAKFRAERKKRAAEAQA
ncbi:hypothetical protein MSHOH_1477 [Methanosarcina horonobensis HB-1 = JCM 15518]|uniref:Uncharacterized protein n=1 Tax=Methanosarcina horonobensis HB-1 = JCM 15518 TaxID=1434110 RepID=A0A0E3WT57_9EURY|nr:hypothetical protein [Methanosarcina horonobensis]AKB77960.1 hypothetical protein MSHOH_1477 [Methanosarcina horonobensis HB-1 = JCM 15518]